MIDEIDEKEIKRVFSEEYKFKIEKWPTWAVILLENAGISLTFVVDELTHEQKEEFLFILGLFELVREGKVKPIIENGEVLFQTCKGG